MSSAQVCIFCCQWYEVMIRCLTPAPPLQLQEIRQKLQERGIALPADRFGENDAELMRYAATVGLCEARSPRDRCII